MSDPNLVTTYNLHGHDYMVKMNVASGFLELLVTDKQTGEEWQCSYDASYVENLTHKTGNYKQFDVFVTMLRSGLLRTSSSISLDLLTYEDLESMRIRRFKSNSATRTVAGSNANNRRYLIVTYTVEFDRIHYPLPLEYCGPPDPAYLQATIVKLRKELADTKAIASSERYPKKLTEMQARIDELYSENLELREKVARMRQLTGTSSKRAPQNNLKNLQSAINSLEKSVASERRSHHQLVERLKRENEMLLREIEKVKSTEKLLKHKLHKALAENMSRGKSRTSSDSVKTMFRRPPPAESPRARSVSPRPNVPIWEKNRGDLRSQPIRSRSSSIDSIKVLDIPDSPSDSEGSKFRRTRVPAKTPASSRTSSAGSNASGRTKKSESLHLMIRNSEFEFKNLEERIEGLHSLLKTNFN